MISVLESSEDARESLAESYSTYRALHPPKPSYLNFITENAPPQPWWQSRLRLLQLLGGERGTQFTSVHIPPNLSYSIPAVLARIEPFQNLLVSESIILDGRQGRHREALHLLIHGLGDYDSAIRYCIYGGPTSSSFSSPPASTAHPIPNNGTFSTQEGQQDKQVEANKTALFQFLLTEFLEIENLSDRVDRTSDLLTRFASWFNVHDVLAVVPDEWSVNILSGFLSHVFRGLVSQRREARIQRSLSLSLNVRVAAEYVDLMEKVWIEEEKDDDHDHGHGGTKTTAAAARRRLRALARKNNSGGDTGSVDVNVITLLPPDHEEEEEEEGIKHKDKVGNNRRAAAAIRPSDGDDDDFGEMVEPESS